MFDAKEFIEQIIYDDLIRSEIKNLSDREIDKYFMQEIIF